MSYLTELLNPGLGGWMLKIKEQTGSAPPEDFEGQAVSGPSSLFGSVCLLLSQHVASIVCTHP